MSSEPKNNKNRKNIKTLPNALTFDELKEEPKENKYRSEKKSQEISDNTKNKPKKEKKQKIKKKVKMDTKAEEIEEKPNVEIKESQTNEQDNDNNNNDNNNKCFSFSCIKKAFNKQKIPFILVGVIILISILAIIFTVILKNKNKNNIENDKEEDIKQPKTNVEPIPGPIPIDVPVDDSKIKKEFAITSKTGDLRRISVVQKSKEETKFNSTLITTKVIRKINYDIYFESEEEASEENQKYYSKMYTGVVTIRSECTSADNDDCEQKPLIDLTSKSKNTRVLSSEDFKGIPIALCIFNITDNDVITTMKCPESLPDNKRNEIILDLYFFRPPAVERADKEGDNITLTVTQENKMTKIRETNGGYCNIYNNLRSKCTTDMNTTLDQEGNLITYDEQAITIINYDNVNSYIKDKKTNLIDISENIEKSEVENYKNNLNNLLPLLDPYMKEEIQFTQQEYDDLYNIIKDKKYHNNETQLQYQPKKREILSEI